MKKKLHNEILKIFKQSLELNKKKINTNIDKKDLQEWDSMSNIALISNIEKKYKFKFKATEINNINTINKLFKIVEKKVKA